MSKQFHKVCKSYDETLDTIANINARDGFTVWHIESFKDNISLQELKANKLTDRKVEALVAFMKLLTDKKYEHLLEEQEKKEK